jgi:hypothetical protein
MSIAIEFSPRTAIGSPHRGQCKPSLSDLLIGRVCEDTTIYRSGLASASPSSPRVRAEVIVTGSSSAGHGEGRLADAGLAAHISCGVHDDVQSRAGCGADAPVANRVDDLDLQVGQDETRRDGDHC